MRSNEGLWFGSRDSFVESEHLAYLQGGTLFYPCAGDDYGDFVELFGSHLDKFLFADISYDFRRRKSIPALNPDYELIDSKLVGKASEGMMPNGQERNYQRSDPACLTCVYERRSDRRQIKIELHREFGQHLLSELDDQSVRVFVHRGDSQGEGGSNVYFLSNRSNHENGRNLFDKLKRKLTFPALIVSGGSNSDFSFLRSARKSIESVSGYAEMRHKRHSCAGCDWYCVGYVQWRRSGRTPVWSVNQASHGHE